MTGRDSVLTFKEVWKRAGAIPGLIAESEAASLYAIAETVPKFQMIVEVGAYQGRSTTVLACSGRSLMTVDPMVEGTTDGIYTITPEIISALHKNICGFKNVIWSRGTSEESPDPTMPVGMLFIDGFHESPWPVQDFRRFQPHLAPFAKIVFHDYPEAFGVVKDVDYLVDIRVLHKTERIGGMVVCQLKKDV